MAKKKKKFTSPFAAAMAHYMRLQDITNAEMGEIVGYSGVMVDAIKHERSDGIEPKRRLIAKQLGFDYESFIEEGERIIKGMIPSANHRNNSQPIQMSEHQKMVERFKNKPLGQSINEKLLEIEELDPGTLERLDHQIKNELDFLKKKHSKNSQAPQQKSSAS